jgi:exodeoxyribonuclease V alpha subunit
MQDNVIEGVVEGVVYTSDDTNFTVCKIRNKCDNSIVTAVGKVLSINTGEYLRLWGKWTSHKTFGRQFSFNNYISMKPTELSTIKKFLGSGLIPGIGEKMAERIVKKFGYDSINIIENSPERLKGVYGLGKKKIEQIVRAYNLKKDVKEVSFFLQKYDVSVGIAAKIYKEYGEKSISILKENPYKLAFDVSGIGFKKADEIAKNLGISTNSIFRAEAGLIYILNEIINLGHVYYPFTNLINHANSILACDHDIIIEALQNLKAQKIVYIEENEDKENNVYLTSLYKAEISLVKKLLNIITIKNDPLEINYPNAIKWFESISHLHLDETQKKAIVLALKEKITVITGGPGTGKTTIINAIYKILEKKEANIALCAPTGRAAKRLSEVTGTQATTIHRLLEYNYKLGRFIKNEENLLTQDVIIVDEVSMIDTMLFYHLISALYPNTKLILVGDVDQLPSVGPGNVLRDLIGSKIFNTIELKEIFRQEVEGLIAINAHRINNGNFPIVKEGHILSDFYFIDEIEKSKIQKILIELVQDRIPNKFEISPYDIQIITPMHKGDLGAIKLNSIMQEILNANTMNRKIKNFKENDKVMQIVNNYEKEVFNGDIGIIERIREESRELIVNYDTRHVYYKFDELEELTLAYALTVHKSQGSEYKCVVILLHSEHYVMLQRNLLYTALTRAKKLAIILGSRKALDLAIRNTKSRMRYSSLKDRLMQFRGLL